MKNKNYLVVIPAYNEEKTIKEVVTRALKFADVYVVNDGSKDDTEKIVKSIKGAKCVTHNKNTHIPQSILDGFKYALEKNYKYVITMDAGLSHKPKEIQNFINKNHSDLVLGVRKRTENVPLHRKFLSRTARILINLSLRPIGSNLPKPGFSDVTSGFRRYSRNAIKLILEKKMKARTFDFHVEALMFVYRNGMKIEEVPISYNFSNSSLNMKVVRDGLRMFLNIAFSNRK